MARTPTSVAADRDALQRWRKILPGVPADQIVIPRNEARDYGFPTPENWGSEVALEEFANWFFKAIVATAPLANRKEWKASMRRIARRAFRWWDSLGEPTPLQLNQAFYTRNDKWKNSADCYELWICFALCMAWFSLPQKSRSNGRAKSKITKLFNQSIRTIGGIRQ